MRHRAPRRRAKGTSTRWENENAQQARGPRAYDGKMKRGRASPPKRHVNEVGATISA